MKKIITSAIILTIISGCNGTTPEVDYTPPVVETKKHQQASTPPVVKVKEESPFDIAKKSCLDGNAQGCIDFGWIMIDDKDFKLAETAFDMAYNYGDEDGAMRGNYYIKCLKKDAESCWMLGHYFEDGKGGSQDYKLARVAYQNAIDLGDTNSLGSLAHLYAKGLGGEKSQVKAAKLFEASCSAGTTDANYEDCFNAALRYEKGEGVRQNNFKAVKLYRKACNGKYAYACNNLGSMYYYGKGVRQDKSTAQMYYGKACDMGSDLGCENYAKNNR